MLEKFRASPTAISFGGWLLFFGGLISIVESYALIAILVQLERQGDISSKLAVRLGLEFAVAGLVCAFVFVWAFRRWLDTFLAQTRNYRLGDIAMCALMGLALATIMWAIGKDASFGL